MWLVTYFLIKIIQKITGAESVEKDIGENCRLYLCTTIFREVMVAIFQDLWHRVLPTVGGARPPHPALWYAAHHNSWKKHGKLSILSIKTWLYYKNGVFDAKTAHQSNVRPKLWWRPFPAWKSLFWIIFCTHVWFQWSWYQIIYMYC